MGEQWEQKKQRNASGYRVHEGGADRSARRMQKAALSRVMALGSSGHRPDDSNCPQQPPRAAEDLMSARHKLTRTPAEEPIPSRPPQTNGTLFPRQTRGRAASWCVLLSMPNMNLVLPAKATDPRNDIDGCDGEGTRGQGAGRVAWGPEQRVWSRRERIREAHRCAHEKRKACHRLHVKYHLGLLQESKGRRVALEGGNPARGTLGADRARWAASRRRAGVVPRERARRWRACQKWREELASSSLLEACGAARDGTGDEGPRRREEGREKGLNSTGYSRPDRAASHWPSTTHMAGGRREAAATSTASLSSEDVSAGGAGEGAAAVVRSSVSKKRATA